MTKSEIDAIQTRQRDIQDEITRLQQEAEELLVALRVIRRFSPLEEPPESKLGPPRPKGIPTLFEMVEVVINKANRGLSGREIVEEIGNDFWPGVQGSQILPSVYVFAKRGRLRKNKTGHFFTVKKNETPDGKASGVSGDEDGTSSSIERNELRS
tara:strand:- start:132 stop:596 length:465 start_codon:yes stop_codon:yes gene_type:complete